jgi:hypothetical protein
MSTIVFEKPAFQTYLQEMEWKLLIFKYLEPVTKPGFRQYLPLPRGERVGVRVAIPGFSTPLTLPFSPLGEGFWSFVIGS